jgi:predicted DNA-binding transcriptional regulator YafY
MSRSLRFPQIEQLLLDHPEGLHRADIARRLGVHKSTIGRDITLLTSQLPLIEEADGRIRLDRHGYLHTIHLTMHELEALHLSARLFSKVMRFPFPHASAALRKLADAQGRVSPALAARIRDTAEELDEFISASSGDYATYRKVIEELGIAISEMRPVKISHFSREKQSTRQFHLFPVTLEPHPEGKAVHLIGWDLDAEEPFFRTIKTERIDSVILEPPDPDLFACIPTERMMEGLRNAWSIWSTDAPPIPVRLCFSSVVADRVAETQWHSSQKLDYLPDGRLIWSALIAEPKEMYPWIRGWGPDVEILEPEDLRLRHRSDLERGVALYAEKGTTDV